MDQASKIIRTIQKGLLQWYMFTPENSVLYVGSEEDALTDLLAARGLDVACANCGQTYETAWLQAHRGSFDYIISITGPEAQPDPQAVLQAWRLLLKPDGVLLLGMNNRLGLRYFCGDRDPYTERNFDGIENYRRAYVKKRIPFRAGCTVRTN